MSHISKEYIIKTAIKSMKLFMETIIFIMICLHISLRVLLVVFVVAAVIFVSQTSFKLKKKTIIDISNQAQTK